MRFQGGYAMQNFNLIKFKMANLRPLLTITCVISEKLCQIAGPSFIWNEIGDFIERFNSIKLKMGDLWPLLTFNMCNIKLET